jgi:hypothetical protein
MFLIAEISSAQGVVRMSNVLTKKVVEAPPAIQMTEAEALISMIERAAKDPAVDIDKMQRLFDMHERITNRAAETAFNTAMAAAQAELVPVARKLNNTQTHSKYADLAAISEAALPIVHKHGFGLSFSECPATQESCMGIICEVTHAGGHSKRYQYNVPLDGAGLKGNANKTATHAYGSTFTYGRRYATCGVFNIATKNDTDGNAEPAKPDAPKITEEQAGTLIEMVESVDGTTAEFCKHFKIEKVSDLPSSLYKAAMAAVKSRAGA